MIRDPETLATKLSAGTLVLIVGGERTFLVAVTGSPEIKTRMIDAYREAGLPVQIGAADQLKEDGLVATSPMGTFVAEPSGQ